MRINCISSLRVKRLKSDGELPQMNSPFSQLQLRDTEMLFIAADGGEETDRANAAKLAAGLTSKCDCAEAAAGAMCCRVQPALVNDRRSG